MVIDTNCLGVIVTIFWAHFFADFVAQTNKMALNKSKSNKWLAIHCLAYTTVLLLYTCFIFALLYPTFSLLTCMYWAIINGIVHFMIDYCTSRGTSYLWKKNEMHWFFTLIGLDQAVHMTVLILTSRIMF